jgi:hypothetical protein
VVAVVESGKRRALVHVKVPYPELNAKSALALVYDQLPPQCGVICNAATPMTIEEWSAWVQRGGPYTDGAPFMIATTDQTCSDGGVPVAA